MTLAELKVQGQKEIMYIINSSSLFRIVNKLLLLLHSPAARASGAPLLLAEPQTLPTPAILDLSPSGKLRLHTQSTLNPKP